VNFIADELDLGFKREMGRWCKLCKTLQKSNLCGSISRRLSAKSIIRAFQIFTYDRQSYSRSWKYEIIQICATFLNQSFSENLIDLSSAITKQGGWNDE
jgi:hypothetical protein